ncbi:AGCS family alanine or glycine:cation symporter [Balneicella halophila]|uniref:AGCS family alanine or glycine:cation symporter n=1 Tax=Balneicella halophila TaxID=1537566 RepID=A0A7L4URA5_BALHA|nr:sodium:alanine symporter family protein [Balneicella halophila]PVX52296.1 AGCS family alanine or glycine:cation symporter [Balneicella halophila]
MYALNDFLTLVDSYIGSSSPWFPILLLGVGIFFTIYLKFPQIRYFKHAVRVVKGVYDKKDAHGDTSHFQALATALSGTVGTGNIAGVAMAIFIGGPAALFWMLVTAFLGMTTKFVEVTLSHKYREVDDRGEIAGGPMYYMKNKLKLPWMAGIFAFMVVFNSFGTGALPQINSIANSVFTTTGLDNWITGLVLAILLGFVILGGIKRIVKVTEKLVPGMALIYFIAAIIVVVYNYENVIPSFISIFRDAFTGTAAVGGFLGASISFAFSKGVGRGLFSNEAGQGSAPIAHASAKTEQPFAEGVVAILEPFIDTIIICTLTGLVLLSSGVWKEKLHNRFQYADMKIVTGVYDDTNPEQKMKLSNYVRNNKGIENFTGTLDVKGGKIQDEVSIIHARSLAEDVVFLNKDGSPLTKKIKVNEGSIVGDINYNIEGESLMHSAPLTAVAFTKSPMGKYGSWVVTLGLLLFAFSTTLAWAYYGGRSIVFLFGTKYLIFYRLFYCVIFFIGSFMDTTIVWTASLITTALMSLPNLVGIFMLRKDMKKTINDYWSYFGGEFPERKKLS